MNIHTLTLGEIAAAENKAGCSIDAMADDAAPKGKMLAALAWVTHRRTDRDFTWAQALDLTLDDAQRLLGITDDEDDTERDEDDAEPGEATPEPEDRSQLPYALE